MLVYLLAFVGGILVKAVDWMEDTLKSKNPVKYLLAVFYGIIIGYLIGTASFGLLFLAALLAQIFARKIDTPSHGLGFLVCAILMFFFGMPQLDLVLFAYFLLLAFLDELEYFGRFEFLSHHRVFLKVGSLLLIFAGRLDYFVGILAFDVGYMLFEWCALRLKGQQVARATSAK